MDERDEAELIEDVGAVVRSLVDPLVKRIEALETEMARLRNFTITDKDAQREIENA